MYFLHPSTKMSRLKAYNTRQKERKRNFVYVSHWMNKWGWKSEKWWKISTAMTPKMNNSYNKKTTEREKWGADRMEKHHNNLCCLLSSFAVAARQVNDRNERASEKNDLRQRYFFNNLSLLPAFWHLSFLYHYHTHASLLIDFYWTSIT